MFPQISNAYDLPLDEFIARVSQADEAISRQRGDDTDPLNAQMKIMQKKLDRMSNERTFA